MLTVQNLIDSNIADVVNCDTSSPDFYKIINEVMRRLCRKGDWCGVLTPVRTCVQRGCVVWPRHVDQVRNISTCRGPIPVHGVYFDYLPWRQEDFRPYLPYLSGRVNAINQPRVPAFFDIFGEGRKVRLYCQSQADIQNAVTVTIYGKDNNGQELMTQALNGQTWTPGIVLTCTNGYAETPGFVRYISRVIKQKSQMPVELFAASQETTSSVQGGYLWNPDTNAWVSMTLIGNVGSQTDNLGTLAPPTGAAQFGYLWNTTLNSWQPVVCRGNPGAYYLQIGGATTSSVQVGTLWSNTLLAWQQVVLVGALGAQGLSIGGASAPYTFNTVLEPIAQYEPSETNPSYLRQQLHAPGCGSNGGLLSVVALCKLKHIDVSTPNDPIIIDNIEAIKDMISSVMARESLNTGQAAAFEQSALAELHRQQQDELPDDQIPVHLNDLCGTRIGRQRCF